MKEADVQALLLQMTIYLAAAVLAVPLSRWLGFGSVLGYLAAGVAIGPALNLVGETESVQRVAEYGIVLMLFLIGLEMRPRVLWDMRHRLLGLGGLQVVVTIALVAALCGTLFDMRWNAAVAVGMILAMSSTAIVLQSLTERKLTHTEAGRASLAVLLFQDVAALPLLAILPLLAFGGVPETADGLHGAQALEDVSPAARAALVIAAVAIVVLAGRYLTRHVYRFLRLARLPEVEIAGALLLVAGVSLVMSLLGLSPALGSFLAGVVLANSEYRHQLEADLGSFKGLLLGLFFMTIGARLDLAHLASEPLRLLGLAAGLMVLKFAVLWMLAGLFGLPRRAQLLFSAALVQGGEFGFVLLSFAAASRVLAPDETGTVLIVIALSMMLSPLALGLQVVLDRRLRGEAPREADKVDEPGTVIIAGMGRFGQAVNRFLRGLGHRTVVLDSRPEVIERLRRLGIRGFYGDLGRPEVLDAAGLADARAIVLGVDDPALALRLVRHIRSHHPRLPVIARARDRHQVYELTAAGATVAVREVFPAAVEAGRSALAVLGHGSAEIDAAAAAFTHADQRMLEDLAALWHPGVPPEHNAAYLAREREQAAAIEAALAGAAHHPAATTPR